MRYIIGRYEARSYTAEIIIFITIDIKQGIDTLLKKSNPSRRE